MSYRMQMVQKNGKILPLCSEFHAFLGGVIFWKVLGLGHEWNDVV